MSRPRCPQCGNMLVVPGGPIDSDVLILGDSPTFVEQMKGFPFVMEYKHRPTGAAILRDEMALAGMQMFECRATYIWQHEKDEKNCDIGWHVDTAMKEIKGRKLVLLLGSDATKAIFKTNVMDISGLVKTHPAFPGVKFVPCPSPASAFNGPIGEIKLALKKMGDLYNDR